ncbi:hypothetical protein SDC9_53164 [bioreactor metagenome]|uniref:Uncharacterized protein n=1 Tax=bioreactor metagenome TaxID=1076179 RepID=A0A644WTJ7_9ZZZZ
MSDSKGVILDRRAVVEFHCNRGVNRLARSVEQLVMGHVHPVNGLCIFVDVDIFAANHFVAVAENEPVIGACKIFYGQRGREAAKLIHLDFSLRNRGICGFAIHLGNAPAVWIFELDGIGGLLQFSLAGRDKAPDTYLILRQVGAAVGVHRTDEPLRGGQFFRLFLRCEVKQIGSRPKLHRQ